MNGRGEMREEHVEHQGTGPRRVRAGTIDDLPAGTSLTVEVGDLTVVLFNVDGRLWALDNTCPHAGGPLGEGCLEGEYVVCPWHGWRYNVRTGEKLGNPEFTVPRYVVETKGEELWIVIPPEERDRQEGPASGA